MLSCLYPCIAVISCKLSLFSLCLSSLIFISFVILSGSNRNTSLGCIIFCFVGLSLINSSNSILFSLAIFQRESPFLTIYFLAIILIVLSRKVTLLQPFYGGCNYSLIQSAISLTGTILNILSPSL